MTFLLDTSAYSAVARGDERLRAPIQRAGQIKLTPVVVGELLAGFKKGGREKENRDLLEEFIQSPRVDVVDIDEGTAEYYAIIHGFLRQAGTPIPSNDVWIAASAAQHGLRLLTLDHHFTRIPHILVDYLEP